MQAPFQIDQEQTMPFALKMRDARGEVLLAWDLATWSTKDTLESANAAPANVEQRDQIERIKLALNAFGDAPTSMIAACVEQGGFYGIGQSYVAISEKESLKSLAIADLKGMIVGFGAALTGPSLMSHEERLKTVAAAIEELGYDKDPEVIAAVQRANKAIAEFQEQPAEPAKDGAA